MKKGPITPAMKPEIMGILTYLFRTVTPLGNSAGNDHSNKYMGRTVYILMK